MNVSMMIFSPTGGTKAVATAVAQELAERLGAGASPREVDVTPYASDPSSETWGQDDVVVIAAPSFGGRVPAVAAERFARANGNGARAIVVCVYGNRAYDDTLVELQDIAEAAGFRMVAAVAAIAEHSIAHQFATGRPDASDLQELKQFANRIAEKLSSGAPDDASAGQLVLPGNRPYKKAGAAGLVPKATKACVNCGACAAACPMHAIDPANCHTVDSKRCISCMRCIAVCPHGARANNQAMVGAVGLALKKACSSRKEPELYL